MGAFLGQRADRQEGPAQLVTLRELAEVKLSGERAAAEASKVLERIVAHSPQDPIATLQLARVVADRMMLMHEKMMEYLRNGDVRPHEFSSFKREMMRNWDF